MSEPWKSSQKSRALGPLFEVCALCEALHPSSEMVDLYVKDPHGNPRPIRLCKHCAYPQLTYIAGRINLNRINVPKLLGFALGLTIAVLNIAFGSVIGGQLGLFVALAGLLTGAGISVAFVVSLAMPGGELQS